jgi:methylmalonyl-CoA mutase C-terminal domain/subunit
MGSAAKLRVLIGKPGLDPHDRGAKILAVALRDAGMEVIYTGIHQTPEAIVNTAIQEDVDVILLSMLSGAHLPLTTRIIELLKEQGAGDIPILCGGIIPDKDIPALKELGVKDVFGPMTPIETCVKYLQENIPSRSTAQTS